MHEPDAVQKTTEPFAVVSGITGHVHPQGVKPRDETRIRLNLTRYLEAVGAAGHHEWRAKQAREEAAKALRDLRAAGGHAEAERYANG